ncbi:MAG TPA: HigA family addiction module antitoxin [Micropepsaceae bacterium]|nr:HigA family addiction module antitoxin [Micropepsaceae bacterium]
MTTRIKKKLATGVAAVCPAVECKPVIEPKKPDQAAHRLTHSARAVNGRKALPDRITAHPGEVLREEFLKPLGLSVNGLAAGLRVPATRIGAIINGERSVTPDTALRLGRFFCNSPEFWINLQAMHDLTRARVEFGHAIDRDIRPLAQ